MKVLVETDTTSLSPTLLVLVHDEARPGQRAETGQRFLVLKDLVTRLDQMRLRPLDRGVQIRKLSDDRFRRLTARKYE